MRQWLLQKPLRGRSKPRWKQTLGKRLGRGPGLKVPAEEGHDHDQERSIAGAAPEAGAETDDVSVPETGVGRVRGIESVGLGPGTARGQGQERARREATETGRVRAPREKVPRLSRETMTRRRPDTKARTVKGRPRRQRRSRKSRRRRHPRRTSKES